jgi:hypothetical protein
MQEYSRENLENHINSKILVNLAAREAFKSLNWLCRCTAYKLIEILYNVGVIGYWDPAKKRFIYALEKTNPNRTLFGNTKFKIHDAFERYLELNKRQLKNSRKVIE